MSGGHYDYICHKITSFADDLQRDLDNNQTRNSYGFYYGFSDDTMKVLEEIKKMAVIFGYLAHHVEWLYSGDYGEETFLERVKETLK